ncbi:MAG: cyclic nucleotide-binding domain-containing protein [Marinisporobacter sp.]|jgi:hypothetical protein|nr:cyclic nucleotide-binding domain-containing protein [Marinisporobacter sp.]
MKVKLFKNIEVNELNNMLVCLRPKKAGYKKKEYITMAQYQFTEIGIIVEGDRVIITKLNVGNMFGEIVAFSNQSQWIATVIGVTDCTILFLPTEEIEYLSMKSIWTKISDYLLEQYHQIGKNKFMILLKIRDEIALLDIWKFITDQLEKNI